MSLSLIQEMQSRADIKIDVVKVDNAEHYEAFEKGEGPIKNPKMKESPIVECGNGEYYRIYNDYFNRFIDDGEVKAILVAGLDAENCGVEHPYYYLPHIYGILVKEEYRNQGIGSRLINEFLDDIKREKFVVDCTEEVKPFYDSLKAKPIYLKQFKDLPEDYP